MSDNTPLLDSSTLDVPDPFPDVPAPSSPRLTPEHLVLLESLEKWMRELHIEQLNLEKQADDAITALCTNAVLLVGFSTSSSVILQGAFSCVGGVVLSSLSAISFGLAFLVAISIAYYKIKRLVTPVAQLKQRRADLRRSVTDFQTEVSNQIPNRLPSAAFGSSYNMRIQALRETHEFNDFWPYYKRMLLWILIAASVHAITNSIVAGIFFCKGKAPGNRAPKFAQPPTPPPT